MRRALEATMYNFEMEAGEEGGAAQANKPTRKVQSSQKQPAARIQSLQELTDPAHPDDKCCAPLANAS